MPNPETRLDPRSPHHHRTGISQMGTGAGTMNAEITYEKGVDTTLRVFKNGQQIGLIIRLGDFKFLAECLYYTTNDLIEITEKLDELNGVKR